MHRSTLFWAYVVGVMCDQIHLFTDDREMTSVAAADGDFIGPSHAGADAADACIRLIRSRPALLRRRRILDL